MLVELKNGETLNGHLVSCDTYMNLTLREVVQTSPDGERFYRLSEAYVRGNNVRCPFCREYYGEVGCVGWDCLIGCNCGIGCHWTGLGDVKGDGVNW